MEMLELGKSDISPFAVFPLWSGSPKTTLRFSDLLEGCTKLSYYTPGSGL